MTCEMDAIVNTCRPEYVLAISTTCDATIGSIQLCKACGGGGAVAYPGFFLVAKKTPTKIFFNQGVDTILAPTFTSHLHLRVLETPLRPTLDTPLGGGLDHQPEPPIRCSQYVCYEFANL